jgi:biotin synthase
MQGSLMDIAIRNNCSIEEVLFLFALPFMDLLYKAHNTHRAFFDHNTVQTSTLISIKTGACPEDCAYCLQSARYKAGIKIEKLLPLQQVIEYAKRAKANGATRFCMGAAWRNPKFYLHDDFSLNEFYHDDKCSLPSSCIN